MSIAAVHAMFKRLELAINQKEERDVPEATSVKPKAQPDVKVKATTSAIQRMWDETSEIKGRLAKLELNNSKKTVTITGLDVSSDKEYGRREIDCFLHNTLGVNLKIEDYYEIGSSTPKTKVVIFHSLRDKLRVMRFKSKLKGFKNESGKPFFINDYYSQEFNEKKKYEKHLKELNDKQKTEDKVEINRQDGLLCIQGEKFVQKIQPPKRCSNC